MAGFRIFLLITAGFLFVQKTQASMDQPLPERQKLYVSEYEQKIFVSLMQNEYVDPFQLFLAGASEMEQQKEELFRSELSSFVEKMERKKGKSTSDQLFLQKLFYKVHRKFLKEYTPYQNFYSLLDKGAYNCLSGTALYALLLDELQYTYRIIETDYHIFLMVTTSTGEEIMIESTDPLTGFLTEKEKIEERINAIRQDIMGAEQGEQRPYHDFKLEVFREINLKELAGLQYFNQAAFLYNKKQLNKAEVALTKGRFLYKAERFEQFEKLLSSLQ